MAEETTRLFSYILEKEFVSKKELSQVMGISISTIDRYMKNGMPYYKFNGKTVRFKISEVMKWIQKGE